MPCDYKNYPPDWKTEIRPRILKRAEGRCERCGVLNLAIGERDPDGSFIYAGGNLFWDDMQYRTSYQTAKQALDAERDAWEISGREGKKPIMIVLTIAHLDHDTANNADDNLLALCQRCHLHHDREHHMQNSRATRNKNKGIQELFNS